MNKINEPSIMLHQHGCLIIEPIRNIICLEASGQYTKIHLCREKDNCHITSKPIKHYEEELKSNGFLRVHSRWIVNINCIEQVLEKRNALLLKGDRIVALARRRKKDIFSQLKLLRGMIN